MPVAIALASCPGSFVAGAAQELLDLRLHGGLQDHAGALSGRAVDPSFGDQTGIVVLEIGVMACGEFEDLPVRLHALPPVSG